MIDLAEFKEKEINRDSLSELSFKNTSGAGIFCKRSVWSGRRTGQELERDMMMEEALAI